MSTFKYNRGDTVRICLLDYKTGSIVEQYGIVLEVNDKIHVRRDSDGALFDTHLDGTYNNITGQQFIQLQKCFLPVSSYKGTLVEWLEFIAHPTEHEDCLKLTVLGVVDGKTFKEEKENHFMDSKIHIDLSKTGNY